MGTLAEEILSHKIGKKCFANDFIIVSPDYVVSHDTTTPLIIDSFELIDQTISDVNNKLIFFDHIYPAASIKAALLHKKIRRFTKLHQISNVFHEGISHQLVVENKFAYPGAVIIGADSHTCTYGALGSFATGMGSTDVAVAYATEKIWMKVPETINLHTNGEHLPKGVYAKDLALEMIGTIKADGASYKAVEYTGKAIHQMSIEERLTLSNMAIEMGAKVGLIQADDKTLNYTGGKGKIIRPHEPSYCNTIEFELQDLVPKIAAPHQVDNVYDIDKYLGLAIDQVFVGTCTNGRLSDLEIVARLLKGRTVHEDTRLIIGPASISILQEAYRRGYIDIFVNAGATVINPGCGPCIGRHEGVLAPGERALTTMNRNFKGRMGSPDAEIYLSSPATAAVSALTGRITDPREWVN